VNRNWLERFAHCIATGFGAGMAAKAPGTWGTLVGIPFVVVLQPLSVWAYWFAAVLITLLGVWACGIRGRELGDSDHPSLVWDEVAGYVVTMGFAPLGWIWIAVGFGLFRLFDIWKPWPIHVVDRKVKNGWGTMVDDLLAGVYAGVCLFVIAKLV